MLRHMYFWACCIRCLGTSLDIIQTTDLFLGGMVGLVTLEETPTLATELYIVGLVLSG